MRRLKLALVLVLLAGFGGWWRGRVASEPPEGARERAPEVRLERELASVELGAVSAPEPEQAAREAVAAPRVDEPVVAEPGLVLTGRVLECAAGASTGVPAVGVLVQAAAESDWGLGALGYADGGAVEPTGTSTRTGADGAFRFEFPDDGKRPWRRWLRVDGDARFRVASLECRIEAGKTRRDGLELVRRAFGALSGRTLDLEGRPVADVEVAVLRFDEAGEGLVDGPTARSDEQGRFTLASVDTVHALEARKPGYALLEGAAPKLAEDGTWSELELVLSASGELRVRVADAAGAPVPRVNVAVEIDASRAPHPEPFVSLRALDRPASAPGALRREVRGDAQGRFELELLASRPLGKVLLEAVDIGMYGISPSRAAQLGASLVLDLGGRTSGEEQATLVLEARRVITGRVLADPPVVSRVRATPVDGGLPFGIGPSGALRTSYSGKSGVFRILGLPAGRYDLEITPSTTFPIQWVRGVEAGTEDLVVPLVGAKPARVVVEVALADGELAETILLTACLRPHGAPPAAAELPRQARLGALEGWPPTLVEFGSGSGSRTDAQGYTSYALDAISENPWTLELDPGLHWIGVKARAKDGNLTFPIGTGLVRVEAGEYRLRFELTPSGAVRGRVHGDSGGRELCAALARAGRLLALDVRQDELRTVSDLGADGYFAFPLAPAGALELRLGSREELLAGRSCHRQELELARGGELWLDVRP